ncbi:MAG: hypothetical protein M3O61_02545 [Gemmatimonadota bacterium]|nr:hypothetical protein [Gemmatimonadota bacterium]
MIGALERFSDPSRRCDHDRIGAHGDKVLSCDLPHPLDDILECVRCIPAALTGWLNAPVSSEDRRRLFQSCIETGGAPFGALLRAPQLLERVRRGEIDRIACFSSKDFGLAEHLARETGSECITLLDRGTRYFGEFAFELLAVIPYAYWLHKQGRLEFTVSTGDTRALYYFSPCHEDREVTRSYVPITEYPVGVRGAVRYDRKAFPSSLDTARWLPPPYKSVYDDGRFRWAREAVIVCNKYSDERYLWHRAPANFIDTGTLLKLIGKLRSRFQVIYVRPRSRDIVNDHQTIYESGDIDAVTSAFPDVLTIQQLRGEHPDLGFNELQLRLFAACRRFVSVLGGSSYLASYFGGTNVVFARRGWEVASGAYERWFGRFSGARVIPAGSPRELLEAAERELD